MRLLKREADGEIHLTPDITNPTTPYAILSHTWGNGSEEVSFADMQNGTEKSKVLGYSKLQFCGEQAARDCLQYFWVDTCCIDKSSSTELSEAINSMFRYYRDATRCYVYLADVLTNDRTGEAPEPWEEPFQNSRWFTRGWTLQELIAPSSVEFFCPNGKRLGDKRSLEEKLHKMTGIPVSALRGTHPLTRFSFDERVSWARNRDTKREEDLAYCLLGLLDISMPVIYGERKENAFRRLKREWRYRLNEHPDGALEYSKQLGVLTHSSEVMSVAVSRDSKMLASASLDGLIRIWDTETAASKYEFVGHNGPVVAVAFSPDSRLLASASSDKTVRLWDMVKGKLHEILTGHIGFVWSVAFSSDSKLLASSSDDGTIRIWDAVTGKLRQFIDGRAGWIWSVAFSPTSNLLASASDDGKVRLWDAATGKLLLELKGHDGLITSVAFSFDSRLLASASTDKTVRLWGSPDMTPW